MAEEHHKDNTCEVCREQVESICHLFWFYDHAKEVWSSCKLSFPFEIHPLWDYMDVIWHLQKWEESRPRIFGANCHDLLGDMER